MWILIRLLQARLARPQTVNNKLICSDICFFHNSFGTGFLQYSLSRYNLRLTWFSTFVLSNWIYFSIKYTAPGFEPTSSWPPFCQRLVSNCKPQMSKASPLPNVLPWGQISFLGQLWATTTAPRSTICHPYSTRIQRACSSACSNMQLDKFKPVLFWCRFNISWIR